MVAVFSALQKALKEGSLMREAMSEAFKKANDAAAAIFDFAQNHPILYALIVLGILMLLAPTIIHTLGFSALGPVEGESNLVKLLKTWLMGHKIFCCSLAVDLRWISRGWVTILLPAEARHAILGVGCLYGETALASVIYFVLSHGLI